MSNKKGFILGIGSNIDPDENISAIITLLLEQFSSLTLSRVLRIPPIGMNSHQDFLNLVLFIETDINKGDLKNICNEIELNLGRDRSDPARKTKDRPADLDILTSATFTTHDSQSPSEITDEYFLYPLLEELSGFLVNTPVPIHQQGVSLKAKGLTFGETATTIHWNTDASNKRVI